MCRQIGKITLVHLLLPLDAVDVDGLPMALMFDALEQFLVIQEYVRSVKSYHNCRFYVDAMNELFGHV